MEQASGKIVAQIIHDLRFEDAITIERVKRAGKIIGLGNQSSPEGTTSFLWAGRRSGVVASGNKIGTELQSSEGMDVVQIRDVTITSPDYVGKTVAAIKENISSELRHGVYVIECVKRADKPLPLQLDTVISAGDVVLHSTEPIRDLQRAAKSIGPVIVWGDKTDFVFHGLGIAFGLLIGLAVVRIGSIPLTSKSGGGALLSGLFGWYRSRNMTIGNMPTGASTLLRDLGLAGFGLQLSASSQVCRPQPLSAAVSPFSGRCGRNHSAADHHAMFFGRYVPNMTMWLYLLALFPGREVQILPGEVLDKAGNSIPTTPFAIT